MSSGNDKTSNVLPSEDGASKNSPVTTTDEQKQLPPPPLSETVNDHEEDKDDHDNDNDDDDDDDNHNDNDWEVQRDTAKAAGDAAFRASDYATAIEHYTTALSLDPENATLLSNRSAAYLRHGHKSLALHDAQACCKIGTMGAKGRGRLAAALQALGRYQAALDEYTGILQMDANNAAAIQGAQDCRLALEKIKKEEEQGEEEEATVSKQNIGGDGEEGEDDLDDFFNDVEEAAEQVVKAKQVEAQDNSKNMATNAIKNHKKDLGTSKGQIARLLADNYQWRNLNPFFVLDISNQDAISTTLSKDDISRRYKALSLLLHPDKNRSIIEPERSQEAYDQVLKTKAVLDDEHKANHARQLIEQGMKHGKADFEKHCAATTTSSRPKHKKSDSADAELQLLLQDFQAKAVQRIFAQIEHKRREVEQRERNQQQREQQQEADELEKQRKSRKFDQDWKQEERVDERIGNWRDFQQTAKKEKKKAKKI
jgi:DnaJ homolog subfamily C member 8